jgi:hypothetical protein
VKQKLFLEKEVQKAVQKKINFILMSMSLHHTKSTKFECAELDQNSLFHPENEAKIRKKIANSLKIPKLVQNTSFRVATVVQLHVNKFIIILVTVCCH